MAFLDVFRPYGTLVGSVVVRGIPPHRMCHVTLAFFRVRSASAVPPFGGDPSPRDYADEEIVKEAEDPRAMPLPFRFERPTGFYYLGVGAIGFFEREGKLTAQVERFFPMKHPCEIRGGKECEIALSVDWPSTPFEELTTYGVIRPR